VEAGVGSEAEIFEALIDEHRPLAQLLQESELRSNEEISKYLSNLDRMAAP